MVTKRKRKEDMFIAFLLDQTGSMGDIKDQTIEAFNSFVDEQADYPAQTFMSFALFNSDLYILRHKGVRIDHVKHLNPQTYVPRAVTPLLDATYRTIFEAQEWVEDESWEGRVLIVIQTDGYENASKEHSLREVAGLVAKCREKGWDILFIGADMDAWGQAEGMGFSKAQTGSYPKGQTRTYFAHVTQTVSSARATGQSVSIGEDETTPQQ